MSTIDASGEKEVRRTVRLLEMGKQGTGDPFKQLAVAMKIKELPAEVRSLAEARIEGEGRPAASSAQAEAPTLEAAVRDVVAELGSSAELARELGLSEAELQALLNDLPGDFESRVAAEAARLAGQI